MFEKEKSGTKMNEVLGFSVGKFNFYQTRITQLTENNIFLPLETMQGKKQELVLRDRKNIRIVRFFVIVF